MKKQKIIILSSLLALALIGVGLYIFYANSETPSSMDEESSRIKDRVIDSYEESGTSPGSDQPVQKPGINETTDKDEVSVIITASEVFADRLSIRAIVQTVTSSGTCTLKLTSGDATKAYTSDVQALPSTTACKGFDIPRAELASGTWTAEITFENDTYHAKTSKDVVIP